MTTVLLERPKTRKRPRSAKSLKREIYDRLWGTDDPEILRTVLKFIRKTVPELPDMPEELLKKLEASDRDFAEGRFHSNEEMIKWFEERKRKS